MTLMPSWASFGGLAAAASSLCVQAAGPLAKDRKVYICICPDDCEGYQIHNHVLDWVIFGGWDYVSAGSLCLIVKYRLHHPEHLIQESTE